MYSLLNINWNPNPELFNLFGISIRFSFTVSLVF